MKTDKLEIYKATDGWRWRYVANGRILADSGQAYVKKHDAKKQGERVTGPFRVTDLVSEVV